MYLFSEKYQHITVSYLQGVGVWENADYDMNRPPWIVEQILM